jgi:hypothetical protein
MRNLLRFTAILVGILLCLYGASLAGWERMGVPCSCEIHAMTFVGSDLYAGSENGVLVSHDNGLNWESLGLTGTYVPAIAASGPNLLAGVNDLEGVGVYFSTDGGANWTPTTVTNATIFSFLVTGSTVLAGGGDGRVFRSVDNGLTWAEGNVGGVCLVRSFAILGTSIFAQTDFQWPMTVGLGVRRSTDDGVTWTPTAMSGLGCHDGWGLCASGDNLMATTCNGIYTSTDGGSSWTETMNDRALGGGFKTGFALGDGKIFATALGGGPIPMSANDGLNWTNINLRAFDVSHGTYALTTNSEYLFAVSAIDGYAIWRCPLSELYVCGDANGDGTRDISDCVFIIAYVFAYGPSPSPIVLGDANNDGTVDVSDAVYLIAFTFSGGHAPCE